MFFIKVVFLLALTCITLTQSKSIENIELKDFNNQNQIITQLYWFFIENSEKHSKFWIKSECQSNTDNFVSTQTESTFSYKEYQSFLSKIILFLLFTLLGLIPTFLVFVCIYVFIIKKKLTF